MTRVFVLKNFRRWQSKLIKQRVARPGQGRSGGYRTLIGYREQMRAVFLFGFAKNEQDNINAEELDTWKTIGRDLNALPSGIDDMMAKGTLTELDCGQIN
jgi:hypothetical protein